MWMEFFFISTLWCDNENIISKINKTGFLKCLILNVSPNSYGKYVSHT